MSETIIVSLITGSITLIGVLISNGKKDAVLEERVSELTREVREHNDFAKKIPSLQIEIENIKEDIKDLKAYHK